MGPDRVTLRDIAEGLSSRSLVLQLPYERGQDLDLIGPPGTTAALRQPALELFGPLTSAVLEALWAVGYPARQEELETLRNDVRQAMSSSKTVDPTHEKGPNIRRGLVLWRVLASLGQTLEEIAALSTAIREWQNDGYPRGLQCGMGERFLRWDAARDGGIVQALEPWTDPMALFELLNYPAFDEACLAVSKQHARIIERLARTACELGSMGFDALIRASAPALRRTFVRYKHRITAMSPASAPIWLPHQSREEWAATDERLATGFGVLDWTPRSATAELVLWPAEDEDLFGYSLLMTRAFELFGLLLASVVRFSNPTVDPIPLLLPPDSELSEQEQSAISALASSDYRVTAMTRRSPTAED